MNVAFKMKPTVLENSTTAASDAGRRVASLYLRNEVKRILKHEAVFQDWEIEAFADALAVTIFQKGTLDNVTLKRELHARQFSKELAEGLASAVDLRF